jgi:hypothetical protein
MRRENSPISHRTTASEATSSQIPSRVFYVCDQIRIQIAEWRTCPCLHQTPRMFIGCNTCTFLATTRLDRERNTLNPTISCLASSCHRRHLGQLRIFAANLCAFARSVPDSLRLLHNSTLMASVHAWLLLTGLPKALFPVDTEKEYTSARGP